MITAPTLTHGLYWYYYLPVLCTAVKVSYLQLPSVLIWLSVDDVNITRHRLYCSVQMPQTRKPKSWTLPYFYFRYIWFTDLDNVFASRGYFDVAATVILDMLYLSSVLDTQTAVDIMQAYKPKFRTTQSQILFARLVMSCPETVACLKWVEFKTRLT